MLTLIANVAANGALGYRGRLLYPLAADMRHFRLTTMGKVVLMGRRTYESLPNGALPHRRNIVLSRQELSLVGAEVFHSLAEALAACEGEEVFVIGGAEVYAEAITLADRLLLTEVDALPAEADAFFPEYEDWHIAEASPWQRDEATGLRFRFAELRR